MSLNDDQQQRIKQLLDEELDALHSDRDLDQRLHQARQRALSRQSKPWFVQHAPAIGFATAATLTVALVMPRWLDTDRHTPGFDLGIANDDFELVSQLEDFEQDIEFYYWLEESEADAG